jgi:hypothetical protein
MTQTSHASTFKGKLKKFKGKWKGEPKGELKIKGACYKCGKMGHFNANYPRNNGSKRQENCINSH